MFCYPLYTVDLPEGIHEKQDYQPPQFLRPQFYWIAVGRLPYWVTASQQYPTWCIYKWTLPSIFMATIATNGNYPNLAHQKDGKKEGKHWGCWTTIIKNYWNMLNDGYP